MSARTPDAPVQEKTPNAGGGAGKGKAHADCAAGGGGCDAQTFESLVAEVDYYQANMNGDTTSDLWVDLWDGSGCYNFGTDNSVKPACVRLLMHCRDRLTDGQKKWLERRLANDHNHLDTDCSKSPPFAKA